MQNLAKFQKKKYAFIIIDIEKKKIFSFNLNNLWSRARWMILIFKLFCSLAFSLFSFKEVFCSFRFVVVDGANVSCNLVILSSNNINSMHSRACVLRLFIWQLLTLTVVAISMLCNAWWPNHSYTNYIEMLHAHKT